MRSIIQDSNLTKEGYIMKRTNLIKKSINLALSILVAGSIVAVGTDGTTLASIFDNNNAIITSVVDAAEVAQIPWSTAYVYGLLPIDLSDSGEGGAADKSYVSIDYDAGTDGTWVAKFGTAITADGQTLQFQSLFPRGFFPLCGQMTGGYYFTDATGLRELDVFRQHLELHQHLWECNKQEFVTEMTSATDINLGNLWYDSVDEGLYYRITCSFNSLTDDGVTLTQCLASIVEVKATGEIYGFIYKEPVATYNDITAKEIIYSCIPTKLQ